MRLSIAVGLILPTLGFCVIGFNVQAAVQTTAYIAIHNTAQYANAQAMPYANIILRSGVIF